MDSTPVTASTVIGVLCFMGQIYLTPSHNVKNKTLDFPHRVKYVYRMAKRLPADVRAYFAKEGRKGGLIGGKARAESLSPERRKEIARAAIKARWAKHKAETK
jgi:hypothetical protein